VDPEATLGDDLTVRLEYRHDEPASSAPPIPWVRFGPWRSRTGSGVSHQRPAEQPAATGQRG
jgi:hypothetical protein